MNMQDVCFLGIQCQTFLEMFFGIIIEGIIITGVFAWLQDRSSRKMMKHTEDHLRKVEDLIKNRV